MDAPSWNACTLDPHPWMRSIECHPAFYQTAATVLAVLAAAAISYITARAERTNEHRQFMKTYAAVMGEVERVCGYLLIDVTNYETEVVTERAERELEMVNDMLAVLRSIEVFRLGHAELANDLLGVRRDLSSISTILTSAFMSGTETFVSRYLDAHAKFEKWAMSGKIISEDSNARALYIGSKVRTFSKMTGLER